MTSDFSLLLLFSEPLYQPATYPGTYVSPDVEAQLGTLVRAALDKAGLHHIKLLAYGEPISSH